MRTRLTTSLGVGLVTLSLALTACSSQESTTADSAAANNAAVETTAPATDANDNEIPDITYDENVSLSSDDAYPAIIRGHVVESKQDMADAGATYPEVEGWYYNHAMRMVGVLKGVSLKDSDAYGTQVCEAHSTEDLKTYVTAVAIDNNPEARGPVADEEPKIREHFGEKLATAEFESSHTEQDGTTAEQLALVAAIYGGCGQDMPLMGLPMGYESYEDGELVESYSVVPKADVES